MTVRRKVIGQRANEYSINKDVLETWDLNDPNKQT